MDQSNISTLAAPELQGMQKMLGHHRHRHMGMSQRIDKMESAINQAATDGKLTSDQATAMIKTLDDIKSLLANTKSTRTPLTDDQRHQIHQAMKDIGKQLFSALNPARDATPATPNNGIADLFSKIDANGDGTLDKDEFTNFVKSLKDNSNGLADTYNPSSYNQKGTLTISIMQQTTISITA
jgi:hypothetical protein